jgi:hypothetical protein
LAERLGENALNNILIPEQKAGGIWTELDTWAGDGLFLDGVVAWLESEIPPAANTSVGIGGRVRDLNLWENGFTNGWSKVFGPGTVSFADPSALETDAFFSQPGAYQLLLLVDDGTTQKSATLDILVGGPDSSALYAAWVATYPTLGTSTNWNDDFEPDGLNNLAEYALGGDPTFNDAAIKLPTAHTDSNWLYYMYNRREDAAARGLSYTLLSGSDLQDGSMTNVLAPFSVSAALDGFESVTNRISTSAESKQFMQLEISYD